MRKTVLRGVLGGVLLFAAAGAGAEPAPGVETRCGWFINPTPGNAWLYDREGLWTVAVQGGHEAAGDWPVFPPGRWVPENGSYGYGCACVEVRIDRATREVKTLTAARSHPLSACRKDRSLRAWEKKRRLPG